MLSIQTLKHNLSGLKAISGVDFYALDAEGRELTRSADAESESPALSGDFFLSAADTQEHDGRLYFKVYDGGQLEYILVTDGADAAVRTIGRMAAFQLQNLVGACKEGHTIENFIRNLLLDNMLLIDISDSAKKLQIPALARRVVMVVELSADREGSERELSLLTIRAHFAAEQGTFITAVEERGVSIIKEVDEDSWPKDIEASAEAVLARLNAEGIKDCRIAIGTAVNEINEVSRSYKEAKMALDVGKIFFDERRIITYNQLGIGRLIYQLPIPLCRLFIREILEGRSADDFDEDMLHTIKEFFGSSLNVSEASRRLFIHRNTLVYRLDKLLRLTGLEIGRAHV